MLQRENFLSTQNVDVMIDHEDMISRVKKFCDFLAIVSGQISH